MELKPAYSYEEQLERMIKVHNLLIKDKQAALRILKTVNYYRISEYGLTLRKPDNREQYRDGTALEDLFALYCFDSRLRHNLLRVLEQIEIQLRAQFSYRLAMEYGAGGYLDSNNFSGDKHIHENLIRDLYYRMDKNKNAGFVKHHINKYESKMPIWVSVELFSFGNLASLYKIMQKRDQKALAALYGTSPDYLNGWILALVEVRNICAHYTRLYNLPLKQTPPLYKEYRAYRGERNKVFAVLLVLKRMLQSNEQWSSLYKNLKHTIEKYHYVIDLECIGFPENWEEILA